MSVCMYMVLCYVHMYVYMIYMYCMYVCMYGMFAFQVLRCDKFAAEWFIFTKVKFFRVISGV